MVGVIMAGALCSYLADLGSTAGLIRVGCAYPISRSGKCPESQAGIVPGRGSRSLEG